MKYKHIEIDPNRMGGKACLTNSRLTVETFMNEILVQGIDGFMKDRDYMDRETVLQTFGEIISNVQRWTERDLEQFRHTRHYFVTVIQTEKDTPDEDSGKHKIRCWGFYPTSEMAQEAVLQNVTDLHELWYQWAMIEEYNYGVPAISDGTTRRWYHWNDIYKKYHETTEPKWAEGIFNWSLG